MASVRILTPDLARGAALLGIAIANGITAWSLRVGDVPQGYHRTLSGIIVNNSLWDKLTIILADMFVHTRGLPMFATLLGYGVGMILVREQRKGATKNQCRTILLRRYGALILFGLLHMVFLFYGDIMFIYGLIILVLVIPMRNAKNKTLLITAGVLFVLAMVMNGALLSYSDMNAVLLQGYGHGYVQDQLIRGASLAFIYNFLRFPFALTLVGSVILVGFVAGRNGVLEHPEQFRMPMRIAATITVIIVIAVGLPVGLASLGILGHEKFLYILNMLVGMASGPGTVVWISWIASWVERRKLTDTLLIRMLIALGRMSMTGYVLQSVAFIFIMTPWFLGIGSGQSVTMVAMISAGIWVITVIFACLWSRTGRRGPLEIAHRTLGYGRLPNAKTQIM
ncbi:DUF418 domain-containing protein [uncultured Corynebacterium sp.]|uniref:DUF418 domain-containing protein n=1 Tax=uncultured Corynebacterium sp. TaxID=159447 RepID=UPI0028EC9F53|nr:DUF418 domain-containing protein [uncultured Corynebacterium sp.]